MREEPEQMLPQQRVAAAGRSEQRCTANHEAGWQEEAGAGDAVHQLEDCRRLKSGERQQQQQRRDQLRPDEERQLHPRHAGRAALDDGGQHGDGAERG